MWTALDGYPFGDRLLEGVMFIVDNRNDKPVVAGVTNSCKPYFNQLNKEMWIKECEKFCLTYDVAQCPDCGDEILIWGG